VAVLDTLIIPLDHGSALPLDFPRDCFDAELYLIGYPELVANRGKVV
jgi:hypothetical protein